MQSHSRSYPPSASSPSTVPRPRDRRPVTFSTRTHRGSRSRMIRSISDQRPDRVPSAIPVPRPARDTSWHGKPPAMRSTGRSSVAPTRRTSTCRGTSGQCFSRTRLANGSHSTCQAQVIPARSSPRSSPPIPANSDPKVRRAPTDPAQAVEATTGSVDARGSSIAIVTTRHSLARSLAASRHRGRLSP